MRPVLFPDRFAVTAILAFILAFVAGYLVWHFTRANQARLAIRSRRTQIKTLWGEVRKFAFRGVVVLVVFILLIFVVLKL
jgi:cell division protein FtsB